MINLDPGVRRIVTCSLSYWSQALLTITTVAYLLVIIDPGPGVRQGRILRYLQVVDSACEMVSLALDRQSRLHMPQTGLDGIIERVKRC